MTKPLVCLLMAVACLTASAQTQPEWASQVVLSQLGSNHQGTDPADALGDTPSTFHSLGRGGNLTLAFSNPFTTTGNGSDDLFIDEWNDNDGFWICLKPANSFTANAAANAGLNPIGAYYQLPQSFHGDEWINLDSFIPGYSSGQLKFTEVMVEDDSQGESGDNGCEVERVKAYAVCLPVPPPPAGTCEPRWALEVCNFIPGSSASSSKPASNALGNTASTYASLGFGGQLILGFGDPFSTSGNSGSDLYIDISNNTGCYWVCLVPADSFTANALQNAGIGGGGPGSMYQLPQQFCSDQNIDIDQFVPGYGEGQLKFTKVNIEGSSSVNLRVSRVEAKFVCVPNECEPGFASSVVGVVAGPSAGSNPSSALGNTPGTGYTVGNGGCITLAFDNVFSTTGNSDADLTIFDLGTGTGECYHVRLKPANSQTTAALSGAGLANIGGRYELAGFYCGDQSIDLDAILPGFPEGGLRFVDVEICDEGNGGNGVDVETVEAARVCNFVAKLGDRIWVDVNCSGIQNGFEGSLFGATVNLYDAGGTTLLQSTQAGLGGAYCFYVDPGTYVVEFAFDGNSYAATQKEAGTNTQIDSNINANGRTDPITVSSGEIRSDIDAGVCIICTGPNAFKNENLPACGVSGEPAMTITMPYLGSILTLSITSQIPNAQTFVWAATGPPVPVNIFLTPCMVYPNLVQSFVFLEGMTDANGNWTTSFELPSNPNFAGLEFTIQGRVCDPTIPGPIPGIPDWPANGIHLILGCF